MKHGIDLSKHNGNIDWNRVKNADVINSLNQAKSAGAFGNNSITLIARKISD